MWTMSLIPMKVCGRGVGVAVIVYGLVFIVVLDPNCVMFDRIEDIPKNLLEDVINNYKKVRKQNVCND